MDSTWENSDSIQLPYGEAADIPVEYYGKYITKLQNMYDAIISGKYDEHYSAEELSYFKSISFDELIKEVLNIAVPEKGDLCRAAVCLYSGEEEYVYFYFQ